MEISGCRHILAANCVIGILPKDKVEARLRSEDAWVAHAGSGRAFKMHYPVVGIVKYQTTECYLFLNSRQSINEIMLYFVFLLIWYKMHCRHNLHGKRSFTMIREQEGRGAPAPKPCCLCQRT